MHALMGSELSAMRAADLRAQAGPRARRRSRSLRWRLGVRLIETGTRLIGAPRAVGC